MKLKKEKRKAVSINPSTLLLYGAPKVGKTTMLSQLDDCLILCSRYHRQISRMDRKRSMSRISD